MVAEASQSTPRTALFLPIEATLRFIRRQVMTRSQFPARICDDLPAVLWKRGAEVKGYSSTVSRPMSTLRS